MARYRVLLFDPHAGGHHEMYLKRFAEVLESEVEVLLVAGEKSKPSLCGYEVVMEISRADSVSIRRSAASLSNCIRRFKPDAAIHMFADRDLVALATGRDFKSAISAIIFRPRSHYPRAFGSSLSRRERIVGVGIDGAIKRFTSRSRRNRAFLLDEYAVAEWGDRPDRIGWLSEPPSDWRISSAEAERGGVALFGSVAHRKGINLLCAAFGGIGTDHSLTIAGRVHPEFRAEFDAVVRRTSLAGTNLRVLDHWLEDQEMMQLARSASVVAVPYPRHFGMSRVMIEAASVGAPVVGTDFGLMGAQIKTWKLGRAVDTSNSELFADAITATIDEGAPTFASGLADYSGRYSLEAFRRAVRSAAFLEPIAPLPPLPLRTGIAQFADRVDA